jgi:hypothetical protein
VRFSPGFKSYDEAHNVVRWLTKHTQSHKVCERIEQKSAPAEAGARQNGLLLLSELYMAPSSSKESTWPQFKLASNDAQEILITL